MWLGDIYCMWWMVDGVMEFLKDSFAFACYINFVDFNQILNLNVQFSNWIWILNQMTIDFYGKKLKCYGSFRFIHHLRRILSFFLISLRAKRTKFDLTSTDFVANPQILHSYSKLLDFPFLTPITLPIQSIQSFQVWARSNFVQFHVKWLSYLLLAISVAIVLISYNLIWIFYPICF